MCSHVKLCAHTISMCVYMVTQYMHTYVYVYICMHTHTWIIYVIVFNAWGEEQGCVRKSLPSVERVRKDKCFPEYTWVTCWAHSSVTGFYPSLSSWETPWQLFLVCQGKVKGRPNSGLFLSLSASLDKSTTYLWGLGWSQHHAGPQFPFLWDARDTSSPVPLLQMSWGPNAVLCGVNFASFLLSIRRMFLKVKLESLVKKAEAWTVGWKRGKYKWWII